ncbi:uncharacterized protein LOC117583784 [Drosophila guanche]|uniref:Aftiphilin clathrin-binding box domain-containing protein n=1 Tax=Drosophila guanche TaxID=7266 RepID=A0A3B0JDW2_DROGU|nr:uncharacterized protein LOC117583784 [Drosophila guanche]SPP80265.1 Hypothetical predicted protein [Drosophila guanche]
MVNVPPLLCSTPPPIDFGEDDDDSGLQSTINLDDDDDDFGLVTSNRSALTKETHTEAQPVYSERPPELELTSKPNAEEIRQNVEAFNYQVKQSPSLDDYQETPPPLEEELQDEDEEEEEEIANINDNVPSLKLDSLSLYSTESVSAASTLSPVAVAEEEMPAPTKAPAAAAAPPVLSHQVTLEDVSDDSDDECSPKKPKELFIREGAEDFFAIEVLATPTETAFSFPSAFSMDKPAVEADSVQFAASFEQVIEQSVEQQEEHQESPAATEEDEFDDFGDFADFSAVPAPAVEVMPVAKDSPAPAADDGFDDFQEFATPPAENADDDDDDFGDFSEPLTAAMPTVAAVPPPPQPAAAPLSIDERIKPVLELMFPLHLSISAATEAKRRPLAQCQSFNFGAIEQAQALDYHWTSSEMRHSLVRALGIDSRNILFGDKWNASMPRFAANLSFDPLKPLKPLEASSQQLSSVGLEATAAAAPQTSQTEARSGASNGENCVPASSSSSSSSGEISSSFKQNHNPCAELNSDCLESTAAASAAAAAAATATLSTALSANGYGHNLNGSEQLHQQQHQQQFDLRAPTPPPVAAPTPPDDLRPTASTPTGFAMPLKETHIYTPSKSDTAVARTTTLAPIDFDYEIAATGIIIDETVVKKEYRDVEYKPPPFGLDSPSRLGSSNGTSSFELPTTTPTVVEDDDFSDFQSMPAKTQAALQPPRNGTPTFGEQMILCPAILLPQAIPLAKTAIEWGDNALSSINAEEMARIEDLFSAQSKPPTISATVAKQPPQQQQQQQQQQEDDEWSDFVSVPVGQQQQQQQQQPQQQTFSNNNNVNSLKKPPTGPSSAPKDDDWSDFVSSTPLPARPSAPQFNSGAWQSANFYNNPLSLYQHQKQTHAHSNLVPSSKSNTNTNHNNNNNNNNNVPATPQQIHIMHDFSTAPSTTVGGGVGATYQQHHQRQQFQIGNAKVAPRISLIPDLSFVAPALPTNAGAFMGSLPKPSFGGKK